MLFLLKEPVTAPDICVSRQLEQYKWRECVSSMRWFWKGRAEPELAEGSRFARRAHGFCGLSQPTARI